MRYLGNRGVSNHPAADLIQYRCQLYYQLTQGPTVDYSMRISVVGTSGVTSPSEILGAVKTDPEASESLVGI